MEQQQEMACGESNGHVIEDVTRATGGGLRQ